MYILVCCVCVFITRTSICFMVCLLPGLLHNIVLQGHFNGFSHGLPEHGDENSLTPLLPSISIVEGETFLVQWHHN